MVIGLLVIKWQVTNYKFQVTGFEFLSSLIQFVRWIIDSNYQIMKSLIILFSLMTIFSQNSISADSTETLIYRYFKDADKAKSVKLSKKLDEISGLAVSPDGRLFAHDDELGIVYQLNTKNGNIVKKFFIGKKKPKNADFEGLCIVGDDFYLITSEGRIFRFPEGDDDAHVEVKDLGTWLTKEHNVEGLCSEPETNSLLLACKGFAGEEYEQSRAIYAFSLDSLRLNKTPRFLISIPEIISKNPRGFSQKLGEFFLLVDPKNFSPSGIERHPVTGNFFILSSQSRMIIEIDPQGDILGLINLKSSPHEQPEGITFLKDNTLVISDEAGDGRARLTFYPLKK